jgi:cell wall-associated NlpC family hydrolase
VSTPTASRRLLRTVLVLVTGLALLGTLSGVAAAARKEIVVANAFTTERLQGPARTVVHDGAGRLVATFTDGSRSVVVTGAARTLREPGVSVTVASTSRVRLLPAPFDGTVDEVWLRVQLADTSPDVLETALQYVAGAPTVRDESGALVSSDASYGPLVDGSRQEGSDWNDYVGTAATYDGVVDPPEADQAGALDCSGFVRMVFGARSGLPMVLTPDGVRLPRRAVQMATAGPGTVVVADTGRQVTGLAALLPGDLVLFDASTDDGTDTDHVGIYLGRDSSGGHRFVSSRKSADGPTMGDLRGASRLDGAGYYAKALRSVRRV